jgi:hypothetical protein
VDRSNSGRNHGYWVTPITGVLFVEVVPILCVVEIIGGIPIDQILVAFVVPARCTIPNI